MNNSKEKVTPKQELVRNLEWLIKHDPDRFYFIETLMKAIVNKEIVSVEMSLNSEIYTVSVRMGEFAYKESFKTLEQATKFIDMCKVTKRETV